MTEPQTLYVNRPLINAGDLITWAKGAGFKKTLPENDVHVTLAFSKEPVEWSDVDPKKDEVAVPAGGARSIERLGDKGAVVLRFESSELTKRWHQFRGIGASWDFAGYKPHVTITYDVGDLDPAGIEPYEGALEFGPEIFAEVDSDWADKAKANLQATDSALTLALDRNSVRTYTNDGHLKVERTHITKANICPYKGSEIPGWQELGLEPERIYQLYRDPEELQKAAPSLNGVPLLRIHKPVSSKDHPKVDTIGSVGTNAQFDGEYLDNALTIWTQEDIDGVDSDEKRELSAGYRYRPDMTPGNFGGKAFDGVMRDIDFNHVAIVEDGRAGPDVVIGDSTENLPMKTTRLAALTLAVAAAHVAPRLAMDIALPKSTFTDLNSKNFKDKTPLIVAAFKSATDGKLRKGMALDEGGLTKLLSALEDTVGKTADESASEEQHKAMEAAASGESNIGIPKAVGEEFAEKDKGKTFDAEPIKAFLREKGMSEDDITAMSGMFPQPATDEDPEEKKKREEKEAAEKTAKDEAAEKEKMKDMVTKPAMDAAIRSAVDTATKSVRETERGIVTAREAVEPWVGKLPLALALDSAEAVHRHAAKMLNVANADKVHADALLPIIQSLPKPGARPVAPGPIAMDASALEGFAKRFPEAARINPA